MAKATPQSTTLPTSLEEPQSCLILAAPERTDEHSTQTLPVAKQSSVFFHLPFEIRLQIYALVFALSSIPLERRAKSETREAIRPTPGYICPSLLLASKNIYNEARLIPFTTNTFAFTSKNSSSLTTARSFLEQLAPWQCDALRNVELTVCDRDLITSVKEWTEVLNLLRVGCRRLFLLLEGDIERALEGVGIKTFATYGGVEWEGRAERWERWVEKLSVMENLEKVEILIKGKAWNAEMARRVERHLGELSGKRIIVQKRSANEKDQGDEYLANVHGWVLVAGSMWPRFIP